MPRAPQRPLSSLFAQRTSGVLLHPTSLPGPHGSGDLRSAERFVDFLARSGQTVWQMLPVCPTGRGNSPYDSESSYAGSPLLVSLDQLQERGLLTPLEIHPDPGMDPRRVAFPKVQKYRESRLRLAFQRFQGKAKNLRALGHFLEREAWVADWALYRAQRLATGQCWVEWEPGLRRRNRSALDRARAQLREEIQYHAFVQFVFEEQWQFLRRHCHDRGIRLLGDVPMFVAHDSAEVWANPELFFLDAQGQRRVVAGVPPDAFSRTGQLWGNPLYRWNEQRKTDYAWWLARLHSVLARFDVVRLDHFIAFHRYWEIPGSARTAKQGRYVRVPGEEFLQRVRQEFGGLPFVAEDLGLLVPGVEALRDDFGLPGMKVLQFAFDDDPGGRVYLPHFYPPNSVAYTGTHDNDTSVGWFRQDNEPDRDALSRRRTRVLEYVGGTAKEVNWGLIRSVLASAANTTIFPLQDLLGLDSRARMNTPGTPEGNWEWRVLEKQLDPRVADRMRQLSLAYGRIPGARW